MGRVAKVGAHEGVTEVSKVDCAEKEVEPMGVAPARRCSRRRASSVVYARKEVEI